MSERTAEAATTVDEDGVRVEKAFTDDAFPVPAVTYDLSSTREDPVRVRIVDRIPESFPMDRIGFHPEYESENWTAYKDHRVEFERVLDPGDSIETVFGIRDDDPDLDGFLGSPVIEHVPVGEEIGDVLGTDDTDAVREVLSGDRATLPGMEDPAAETAEPEPAEPAAGADDAPSVVEETADEAAEADGDDAVEEEAVEDETVATEPRTVSADGTAAVTGRDETGDDSVEADDAAADETTGDEAVEDDEPEPPEEPMEVTDEADEDEDTEDEDTRTAAEAPPKGGLAAALAAEIRADEVASEDLDVLRDELDVGVPRSVDVRIARLQSSLADIEAYADALAEFIDGEGTAREILDDLDQTVAAVESEMDALDDRLNAAAAERGDLRETVSRVDDDVDAVSSDVDEVAATVEAVTDDVSRIDEKTDALDRALDDVGGDVETLYEEVETATAAVESTTDRVDGMESRLGRFDEEFDDLWDDLAEVDSRLTGVEDQLGDDLDDVEAEISDINDHLEELEAFRKRLNEAFGP